MRQGRRRPLEVDARAALASFARAPPPSSASLARLHPAAWRRPRRSRLLCSARTPPPRPPLAGGWRGLHSPRGREAAAPSHRRRRSHEPRGTGDQHGQAPITPRIREAAAASRALLAPVLAAAAARGPTASAAAPPCRRTRKHRGGGLRQGGEPPPPWEDGRASGHPVRAGEGSTTRWRTAEQGGADAGGGRERGGREEREWGGRESEFGQEGPSAASLASPGLRPLRRGAGGERGERERERERERAPSQRLVSVPRQR